ncbi:hypothetical protein OBBRIDRAFT_652127 [Obba rivulosa]|uniref:Uncharacterized protein n=1 Tax=Obba rivulosa TaxID=1052685 RepID=A0A8E2DK41_9APHY|nr:hypothetical protein OBBRIDRAFT_652127 [Obba rivulosa]
MQISRLCSHKLKGRSAVSTWRRSRSDRGAIAPLALPASFAVLLAVHTRSHRCLRNHRSSSSDPGAVITNILRGQSCVVPQAAQSHLWCLSAYITRAGSSCCIPCPIRTLPFQIIRQIGSRIAPRFACRHGGRRRKRCGCCRGRQPPMIGFLDKKCSLMAGTIAASSDTGSRKIQQGPVLLRSNRSCPHHLATHAQMPPRSRRRKEPALVPDFRVLPGATQASSLQRTAAGHGSYEWVVEIVFVSAQS